ncbi:MAG: Mrp/NBP35 family ATP-binding protein [Actinomycetota bacterium]
MPTTEQVMQALAGVIDPEIGKPITELEMVKDVKVACGRVTVEILLTVASCPMKGRIATDVTDTLKNLEGVVDVEVVMGEMSKEQRETLVTKLRGGRPEREISFWKEGSTTRVISVASGKGGVGKSSITTNLAVALSHMGYAVGVVDCDIWGFSVPRMLGVTEMPTSFNGMILPPEVHGVRVMSMGFFVPEGQAVIWRGPMLHRAIEQFLTDVCWGQMDVILADLPPGTGDVSISFSQMLPGSETLIVTTPQEAAEKVALLAGRMTEQTKLDVIGVVENMSYFECPNCQVRHRLFGEGGGKRLAEALGVPLLGEIPMDIRLREGSDAGEPLVISHPDSPAALALKALAEALAPERSLVRKPLPLV